MAALPRVFCDIPLAHRGLHGGGLPENSLAAARAAIEAGYGIEVDIQPAADGTPMVFHDQNLFRMTGVKQDIVDLLPKDLAALRLAGGDQPIPTLSDLLDLVAGRAPLLIEIKDQDGRLGPNIGNLHQRVAEQVKSYAGPVAIMSFNPHIVKAFHKAAPSVPVGLTCCGFNASDWPQLDSATRTRLARIEGFDDIGARFISHDRADLDNPQLVALKSRGIPILCWTIQSAAQDLAARRIVDNITFERYLPMV